MRHTHRGRAPRGRVYLPPSPSGSPPLRSRSVQNPANVRPQCHAGHSPANPHRPYAGPPDQPQSARQTAPSPGWRCGALPSSSHRCPRFRPGSCRGWDKLCTRACGRIGGRGHKRVRTHRPRSPAPTGLRSEDQRGSGEKNQGWLPRREDTAPQPTTRQPESTGGEKGRTQNSPGADAPEIGLYLETRGPSTD